MSDPTPLPRICACGWKGTPELYDIGSGPEWSCPACEWCHGALGQPLRPFVLHELASPARLEEGTPDA